MKTYRKYDQSIVQAIQLSGNINLYPKLKSPRTTALYWIKNYRKANIKKISGFASLLPRSKTKNEFSSSSPNALENASALTGIIFSEIVKQINNLNIDVSQKRKMIIHIIEKIKNTNYQISIKDMLEIMKISYGTYYRWRTEVLGCEISKQKCQVQRANQVSRSEIKIMTELALNKRYAHLSIKSLMYFAQKNNILTCSYDSWRKYLKLSNIKRYQLPRKKFNKKRKGIRASAPNELWHVDITEIIIRNNQKYYLQIIVDNYSRAIISWKISDFKDAILSLKTLLRAFRQGFKPQSIMSDGGKENKNKKVTSLLLGKGVRQLIAFVDILFSNSMVESFFKKMKSAMLFHRMKSLNALKIKITSFIKSYNNEYPHSELKGATPLEALHSHFNLDDFKRKLRLNRQEVTAMRKQNYDQCMSCLAIQD
jgi:putative transposase